MIDWRAMAKTSIAWHCRLTPPTTSCRRVRARSHSTFECPSIDGDGAAAVVVGDVVGGGDDDDAIASSICRHSL